MRTISKRRNPPPEYVAWLRTEADDVHARPTWVNMPGTVKAILDEALIEEQGRICCYCGGRIGEVGLDHHIEHLVPGRTPANASAIAYANLLASCGPAGGPPRSQHCGEHKGDEHLPVTPLQDDCAAYFRYTLDGRILPTLRESEHGQAAIAVLNLGEALLVRRRAGALRALDDLADGELQALREHCNRVRGATLDEFCFVIAAAVEDRLGGLSMGDTRVNRGRAGQEGEA